MYLYTCVFKGGNIPRERFPVVAAMRNRARFVPLIEILKNLRERLRSYVYGLMYISREFSNKSYFIIFCGLYYIPEKKPRTKIEKMLYSIKCC